MLGGNSKITLENKITGNKFSYHIQRNLKDADVLFVHCLNWAGITCIGAINDSYMRKDFVAKLLVKGEIEVKAFNWLWKQLEDIRNFPEYVIVSHTGKCARCTKLLTDSESIERGFGPECWKTLGLIS